MKTRHEILALIDHKIQILVNNYSFKGDEEPVDYEESRLAWSSTRQRAWGEYCALISVKRFIKGEL